jgi:hypothetical protein
MKRILLAATLGVALTAGGIVAAQAPAPKADEHAAHHPAAAPQPAGPGGMMGGGMMGGGMMGGGMCPMMGGANTKIDVKKIDKGVTITLTSSDPATVTRIQKMAEAMRLMHEAMSQ